MRTLPLGSSNLSVSRIAYGCAGLGGSWDDQPLTCEVRARAEHALRAAIDAGIGLFDHADIYCRGKSETVFAEALAALGHARDRITLQSKCGIRFADDPAGAPARYDFSASHIAAAVDGSLRRLRTDRLDVLLLHRPDPLAEPEEVARAFDRLHADGKVRHFGVSNFTASQIELLRRHVRQPIVANQVQLSVVHSRAIDAGILANRDEVSVGAEALIDACRLHGITLQAYSPLAGGQALGDEAKRPALAKLVRELAAAKRVDPDAIPIAWLLRHPARIQPVIGSARPERIAGACQGDGVELSREEWYALYAAARGRGVP